MFFKIKKRNLELMDTISEMLKVLSRLNDPMIAVSDCIAATEIILTQLNQEETIPQKTIEHLKSIHASFEEFSNNYSLINEESTKMLNDQVIFLKAIFDEEIKAKLNIVFFPYKASMWDSMATVYEAAAIDNDCIARVIPIPYYELSQDKATPVYEGDRFPQGVPITHYSQYALEQDQPDIIFIHNIYDEYNTLTRVHEKYFSSNLKKFTDMLVYVPYHVSSFISPKKGDRRMAYSLPTVGNVDKIIVAGDYLKTAAIRDGIPEEKILALGSPKLDALVNALKKDVSYPDEWKKKIEGKTVYLLNTGCMFFATQTFLRISNLANFLNIANINKTNVVIWRPHPLTKASILKYTPHIMEYYNHLTERFIKQKEFGVYNNIILDETDDYLPALKAADVLVSGDGSLLRSYLIAEKKVLFLDKEMPEGSLIPSDAFYYFYNEDEPWHELVKKFSQGYDPLAENRKGMAAKVYANTDGTCGEKVYQTIKECVLS